MPKTTNVVSHDYITETVPYIQGMLLGRTYNFPSHSTGKTIFPTSLTENPKVIDRHTSEVKYSYVKNAADMRKILNISGEFSLKAKAGIVGLEGVGSYLTDDQDHDNVVEIIAKSHVETVMETMEDGPPTPNWHKSVTGTHYIRSITYGGDLIASIQYKTSDKQKKEEIEAKVKAGLGVSGVVDAAVGGKIRKLNEEVRGEAQNEIKYFATLIESSIPRDVEGMLQALDDFKRKVMEQNKGKGVPLSCELVPLCSLRSKIPLAIKDKTLEAQLGKLEDDYDDVRLASKKLQAFLSLEDTRLNKSDEERAFELETTLEEILSVFNKCIGKLDVTEGGNGDDTIKVAFAAYKNKKRAGGFRKQVSLLIQDIKSQQQLRPQDLPAVPPGDMLTFLVVGRSGHGKSSSCNTILNDDNLFRTEPSDTIVTDSIKTEQRTFSGRTLCLIDTPGDESKLEETEVVKKLPKEIHAILLTIRFGCRMTNGECMMITHLKRLLGPDALKNYGILLVTFADNIDSEIAKKGGAKSRQEYFTETMCARPGRLQDILKECQNRFVLFNNMELNPIQNRRQLIELVTLADKVVEGNKNVPYIPSLATFFQRVNDLSQTMKI